MYVRDDKADEIVSRHEEIQRAVRGTAVMLVVPGHGAHVLTNMGLTLGWIGSSLAVYGLLGSSQRVLPYYLLISLIAVTVMSFFVYRVLRGLRLARSRMFAYAVTLLSAGIAAFVAALVGGDGSTVVAGALGVLASIVSARCIAGANYALFAAFFRAKRAYSEQVNAEIDRVRRGAAG